MADRDKRKEKAESKCQAISRLWQLEIENRKGIIKESRVVKWDLRYDLGQKYNPGINLVLVGLRFEGKREL